MSNPNVSSDSVSSQPQQVTHKVTKRGLATLQGFAILIELERIDAQLRLDYEHKLAMDAALVTAKNQRD